MKIEQKMNKRKKINKCQRKNHEERPTTEIQIIIMFRDF